LLEIATEFFEARLIFSRVKLERTFHDAAVIEVGDVD
jgi:hypothetical protein